MLLLSKACFAQFIKSRKCLSFIIFIYSSMFISTVFAAEKKVIQSFEPGSITVHFKHKSGHLGATIPDIISKQRPHLSDSGSSAANEVDFEILVPHYSQRIYDKEEILKYFAEASVKVNPKWKMTSGKSLQNITYNVTKMPEKDSIASAIRQTPATWTFVTKELDHTGEPKRTIKVYLNIQTPTILLSIHKPGVYGASKPLAYRPDTKEEDSNEEFGTTYAGIMKRNEDNDDEDPLPAPDTNTPFPRDNDDDLPSKEDNDLVGLKLQCNIPDYFAFEKECKLMLKFNHTKDQVQIFDGKSKTKVTPVDLETLKSGVDLKKEITQNEHLYQVVKEGKETLYIEGLGSSESSKSERYDDNILKATLTIEIGSSEKKYCESIGILFSVDLDVDSNNNEGFSFDYGSTKEESIEGSNDPNILQKVVPSNNGLSADGVIDWADGFDINPNDTKDNQLANNKFNNFVPLLVCIPVKKLKLNENDKIEVMFVYKGADPAKVTYSSLGNNLNEYYGSEYKYSTKEKGFRIWTKTSGKKRKKESIVKDGDFVSPNTKISWATLRKHATFSASKKSEKEMIKLYIENVNASGRKNLEIKIYIQGREIGIDKIKLDMVTVDILEVASDQIPGTNCNKLPSKFFGGYQNNPMLMSTRTGEEAHLRLKISTGAGGHGSDLLARSIYVCGVPVEKRGNPKLTDTSYYNLQGTSSDKFNPVSQWTKMKILAYTSNRSNSGKAERYEIVWAVDLNGDNRISKNEIFGSFGKTPKTREDRNTGKIVKGNVKNLYIKDLIHICNERGTRKAWQLLEDEVDDLPGYAGDFAEYFLHGRESEITDEAEGVIKKNILINSKDLSHPLGIKWAANCSGHTVKVYFDNDSDLSDFLGEHLEDNSKFYKKVAEAHKAKLIKAVSPTNKVAKVTVNFDMSYSLYGEDTDLAYSFGNVDLKGTAEFKVTYDPELFGKDQIHVELGLVKSKAKDIYDFTYRTVNVNWLLFWVNGNNPVYASVLQSSATSGFFPKSSIIGRPFFIEIDIKMDAGWDNVVTWEK